MLIAPKASDRHHLVSFCFSTTLDRGHSKMLPSCHYTIPARSAFLFYHVVCLPPFYHESAIGGLKLVSIVAEICRMRECAGVPRRVAKTAVAPVRRHLCGLEGSAGAAADLWLVSLPRRSETERRCPKVYSSRSSRA